MNDDDENNTWDRKKEKRRPKCVSRRLCYLQPRSQPTNALARFRNRQHFSQIAVTIFEEIGVECVYSESGIYLNLKIGNDALDHLQNDSVLQPDAAEAEVPASNQNSTLNSTLSESFVKMLDDPSLVADDLEENIAPSEYNDTNSPAKGMKAVQPNLSGNAPAKNEGEEVKNVENLKETLYSLDFFVHEIAYENPDSFPDSNLRIIFKFLDFPPVRISPTIETQQTVAGDAGSAVPQASKEGRTKQGL